MATFLTPNDTARRLRKALKSNFPATKFSVRLHFYDEGASIWVRWQNGATKEAVQRVTERFRGADVDLATGKKVKRKSLVSNPDGSIDKVNYGIDFIFLSR